MRGGGYLPCLSPSPFTQLMLVTCFLWRSTQICTLWAMVSNNQLFYISQNMHFIYFFCVNWYLNSNRQDNGVHAIFLIFQNYIWKRLRRLNFKGIISDQWNYFWSMELLQGCWYKGGGLYSAKAVKRWKRTRRQWKPIKVEQREPSPPQSLLQILIHYIILRTSEEWRQS